MNLLTFAASFAGVYVGLVIGLVLGRRSWSRGYTQGKVDGFRIMGASAQAMMAEQHREAIHVVREAFARGRQSGPPIPESDELADEAERRRT